MACRARNQTDNGEKKTLIHNKKPVLCRVFFTLCTVLCHFLPMHRCCLVISLCYWDIATDFNTARTNSNAQQKGSYLNDSNSTVWLLCLHTDHQQNEERLQQSPCPSSAKTTTIYSLTSHTAKVTQLTRSKYRFFRLFNSRRRSCSLSIHSISKLLCSISADTQTKKTISNASRLQVQDAIRATRAMDVKDQQPVNTGLMM